MHFQWEGQNTAVSTPVDRLWWLIPHATPLGGRYRGVLRKNGITSRQCCDLEIFDAQYLGNRVRYRVDVRKPPTAGLMVTRPMTSRDTKCGNIRTLVDQQSFSLLQKNVLLQNRAQQWDKIPRSTERISSIIITWRGGLDEIETYLYH